MRKLFAKTILFASASLATSSFAWNDFTSSFTSRFSSGFEGTRASLGYTEIESRCLQRVAGRCIAREKVKAKGQLEIGRYLGKSGEIHRMSLSDPLRPDGDGYAYSSNLKMEFRYSGLTRAKKEVSGQVVDHPWSDLHPTGKIVLHFNASRTSNWVVGVEYRADPGHDDRPNKFMANHVAKKLAAPIKRLASRITGQDVHIRFN